MLVLISNHQSKQEINLERVTKKAKAILSALDCHDAELSIVITDDDEIGSLNRIYREKDRPTNVLAFSMHDGPFAELNAHVLGDVVISTETCMREANESGSTFSDHFDRLLIHGILHLLGYDHEDCEEEAEMMEQKERELFSLID